MSVAARVDILQDLDQAARLVNAAMCHWIRGPAETPLRLLEAMRYSLEAGGKRLRPALVLWSCELCSGDSATALPAALAIECVHTFSLIHDDLPALDNDDFRRGRPSSHRQFGEATAILAGDALLALSFEIIATEVTDPAASAAMIRELAEATGWRGMIGGEAADIDGETRPPDAALVGTIHAAKTARLIEAACRLGAIAAGADKKMTALLGTYGHELGLAFQAADDLLDATGTAEELGKPVRRDAESCKQTYPRAVGLEAARRSAEAAAERAIAAVAPLGDRAIRLSALARYVVERNK